MDGEVRPQEGRCPSRVRREEEEEDARAWERRGSRMDAGESDRHRGRWSAGIGGSLFAREAESDVIAFVARLGPRPSGPGPHRPDRVKVAEALA